MHTESCPLMKMSDGADDCSTANDTSILEEDLALSSSTLGPQDKGVYDKIESKSQFYHPNGSLVYLNEETMDCNYSESVDTRKNYDKENEASSPEMFESDEEEAENVVKKDFRILSPRRRDRLSTKDLSLIDKSTTVTDEELMSKSDYYLLARINKFLTGVPPPPNLTICQSDCTDFLTRLRDNRHLFFADPFGDMQEEETTTDENTPKIDDKTTATDEKTPRIIENIQNSCEARGFDDRRGKNSLRNLTNAFDACERCNETTSVESKSTREHFSDNSNDTRIPLNSMSKTNITEKMSKTDDISRDLTMRSEESSTSTVAIKVTDGNEDTVKHVTFNVPENERKPLQNTIAVGDVMNMSWDLAYRHKSHGIHYNRSKIVEEFEMLTMKLCQRYVGAETQSSCNIWFTKQVPGSVKKRQLLSRRNNGQSPGKRLSHLARRRRTFSSANLQVLGMVDKKQLVLNIKKPTIRKGKSPRGKSPRGKSPRGSAKKRAGSNRVSQSPRKAKLETSKRALFQSPPGDRAGPSNRTTASMMNPSCQQRIKRALFSTSKTKSEVTAPAINPSDIKRALSFEESKKRKSEDDLEGPRFKWAKSLSFDCAHATENSSTDSWTSERHSTGNVNLKAEISRHHEKSELSEAHRKKLLWAVAEALRGKGISMGHPRFKQCASQLARIVKKYMPDLENPNVSRKPGSTSDRMLRLAKRHVLLIVESKSTD